MKILVISHNYPSKKTPDYGVFVYNLVQKFCDIGHKVTVISPQKWWYMFKKTSDYGHEKASVFRPKINSYSNISMGTFHSYKLTHYERVKAIKKTVINNQLKFDVVYCHFLVNGFAAFDALSEYGKPIVTAIGESVLNNKANLLKSVFGEEEYSKVLASIRGFVSVSEKLREELIKQGVPDSSILLAPNATDLGRFRIGNQQFFRKKHKIPEDKFIIAFTGSFIERKGPNRLMEAIRGLDEIAAVFIGQGPDIPSGKQIVFRRSLSNHLVPELLRCADVFVLPTLNEGSNNAIIEAMASGLPIVSSDIPEIRSLCDSSFSILVDPMDISAIRNAIITLKSNDELRNKMSGNAVKSSKSFDINDRTARIITFLSGIINE